MLRQRETQARRSVARDFVRCHCSWIWRVVGARCRRSVANRYGRGHHCDGTSLHCISLRCVPPAVREKDGARAHAYCAHLVESISVRDVVARTGESRSVDFDQRGVGVPSRISSCVLVARNVVSRRPEERPSTRNLRTPGWEARGTCCLTTRWNVASIHPSSPW